jgi:hypothetical protein
LFSLRDFKIYDVQNRFVVMPLSEPQVHMRTVNHAFERYGQQTDSKKCDLEFEDRRPKLQKRGSMLATNSWFNMTSTTTAALPVS